MIKMATNTTSLQITSTALTTTNCHNNTIVTSIGSKTNIIDLVTSNEETDADEAAVPDSTTPLEKERVTFNHGEDVLLKHKDGRYYLGTIVEIDYIRDQCLLRFGDNTESWASTRDLTKLSLPDEDLLCVICKKSSPKDQNDIVVCDKCGRGYHLVCHQPPISLEYKNESNLWHCKKCVENIQAQGNMRRIRETTTARRNKDTIRKICSGPDEVNKVLPIDRSKLPYDPDLLNWDTYHRVNMEQIYCYCGRNGEWYTQMLQCGRCRQWFHEKCVKCLQYPLYCGDRFYVFVCSICNYGKEFLRRLEMKWVDMVHLMLFNLTAFKARKYYDLDKVVIPYINDNWHALQLPPKIHNVSKSERRDFILSVLTNNRNRFKCGREIKKRTTIWGLRVRLPPPAPCVTLPSVGPISETELKERWHGNRRLQFLPVTNIKNELDSNSFSGTKNNCSMVVPVDPEMVGLMMGMAYHDHAIKSETDSPCPSPEIIVDTQDNKNRTFTTNFKHKLLKVTTTPPITTITQTITTASTISALGYDDDDDDDDEDDDDDDDKLKSDIESSCPSPTPTSPHIVQKQNISNILLKSETESSLCPSPEDDLANKSSEPTHQQQIPQKPQLVGAGFVKRSVPFPQINNNSMRRKRLLAVNGIRRHKNHHKKLLRKFTRNENNEHLHVRMKKLRKLIKNSEHKQKKEQQQLPPTPPVSSVGSEDPPTPPLQSANQTNLLSEASSDCCTLSSDTKQTNNTPSCDTTSDGDETSSKSTLDLIIPPPKDFEGKNNPFHNLSKENTTPSTTPVNSEDTTIVLKPVQTVPKVSLPLSLTPVIPPLIRTLKRQLSEKDICIGPNGEVKRRRHRRTRSTLLQVAASKNATILPPTRSTTTDNTTTTTHHRQLRSTVQTIPNCVDYALNGRRLRQRQEKDVKLSSTSTNSSPNNSLTSNGINTSPTKSESNISMDDLKSSVNIYFGAANRIASGEKFSIRASRLGPEGKIQYLIEWDGGHNDPLVVT